MDCDYCWRPVAPAAEQVVERVAPAAELVVAAERVAEQAVAAVPAVVPAAVPVAADVCDVLLSVINDVNINIMKNCLQEYPRFGRFLQICQLKILIILTLNLSTF